MLKKTIVIFTLIFCLNLCLKFLVLSQESLSGAINGIVQDKMMRGMEDVQVEIVEADKICHTDETGCFYFDDLEPGCYTMCFSMDDYQTVKKSVTLQKGQTRYLIVDMLSTKRMSPAWLNPDLSNPMEAADVYLLYVACAGSRSAEEINNSDDIIVPYSPLSKKKNVLMTINSLSGSAVDIIEWKDNISPFWLAMRDGKILYITDSDDNITVMDTERNNSVITVIPMKEYGYMIGDITTGTDGNYFYCTWAHNKNPLLKVLDTTTNTYVKTIPLPALKDNSIGQPWAIAAHAQRVYVALETRDNGEVAFINTACNMVEGTVTVGRRPLGLAITPDGEKLYVTNSYDDNVSVIDTSKKEVINTVKVGFEPIRVAITPDGKKVFVSNRVDNSVSIIDSETDSLVATLPSGREPVGIAISGDGKFAFVTNSGSDDITIIDVEKNTVISCTRPSYIYRGRPFGIVVK